jgi:hypothetical protein
MPSLIERVTDLNLEYIIGPAVPELAVEHCVDWRVLRPSPPDIISAGNEGLGKRGTAVHRRTGDNLNLASGRPASRLIVRYCSGPDK